MRVNTIQNVQSNNTFGAIIPTSRANGVLFNRIRTPKWNERYKSLVAIQDNNNTDILLDAKNNRLEAVLRNTEGLMLKEKENLFSSIFRLNPVKFIRKMCEKADKY